MTPYQQTTATLGGTPTSSVDVPLCALFIALLAIGAAGHMTLFRLNLGRNHKFIPSAATFSFCMTRITANCLRIAWAYHPSNVPLTIAAQVFVTAGVVILFVLNLLFAQRILREVHPSLGWSRSLSVIFKGVYGFVFFTLVLVITSSVESFYTLNVDAKKVDMDLLRYGTSYLALVASLPLLVMVYVFLTPHGLLGSISDTSHEGRQVKTLIVTGVALLLSLGAWFRAGINYLSPRPRSDPGWYQSKAFFYVFNFAIEILVVYIYLISRVDKRFYVSSAANTV